MRGFAVIVFLSSFSSLAFGVGESAGADTASAPVRPPEVVAGVSGSAGMGIAAVSYSNPVTNTALNLNDVLNAAPTIGLDYSLAMDTMEELQQIKELATALKVAIKNGKRAGISSANPTVAPFIESADRLTSLIINSNGDAPIGPELRITLAMANKLVKSLPPGVKLSQAFGNETVLMGTMVLAARLGPKGSKLQTAERERAPASAKQNAAAKRRDKRSED